MRAEQVTGLNIFCQTTSQLLPLDGVWKEREDTNTFSQSMINIHEEKDMTMRQNIVYDLWANSATMACLSCRYSNLFDYLL